jgi:hypothetical protein
VKILTGHVELIEVNLEVRCGGVAVKLGKMPLAVDFQSI